MGLTDLTGPCAVVHKQDKMKFHGLIRVSLAGKVNSISTIYTLDIHKKYFQKEADEKKQVYTGRIAVFAAMILAVLFTWNDLLGIGGVGGFT